MASLFDQYEQASSRKPKTFTQRQAMPEPIATGFINARLEDDTPVFNKQRINFNPPDPITHLCVCNNFLVMAMSTNILLRIDLEHPDTPDEVELPRTANDKVYSMFLDPTGHHLIISMNSQENYYLPKSSKKARQLSKMKGHLIDSIGWNRQNTNNTSTSAILLGTSRGLIFEAEIVSGEERGFFQGSLEQYCKQLFSLSRDKTEPVTGLEFEKMTSSLNEYKYFIIATTPGRLYQFIGTIPSSTEPPMFTHVFQDYEDVPERFLELPGNFGYSKLLMYHAKFREQPRSFAWMTGPGVYHGSIDYTGASGQDSVTVETKLMPYPNDEGDRPVPPMSIVLTEFHVLILFPDKLKAMCVLNDQLIYDDTFTDRFGKLLGLCKDPLKGTIWAYTNQAVFKYKVIRESRDVWQMYLDVENFEAAKNYCKDNPANMDRVLTKEAEYNFKNKNFGKSALLYAQTQNSFEEIALKFIQVDEKNALKSFLIKKLSGLRPQDKTQMTMIVTWLVEIYLNQLGILKEQEKQQDISENYQDLQDEFQKFLAQTKVKECVDGNRNTIYDLIASHGDVEDMVYFAVLMKDFERVIGHHLQHEQYDKALEVLVKQPDKELLYKFSPLLMQNIPELTVDAWINTGRNLDPKRLIPALVQYDHLKYKTQGNAAIRYLEFCVQTLDCQEQSIHNYLLSLYAKLKPEQLMTYLNFQGQESDSVCYDLKYALRLCAEHKHQRACVHIYSTMGLYEEAVDLALKFDVELAKQNANKPSEEGGSDAEELRKKLWLRIARHVVEEEKDIKRAMEFLHECDLLKIEDILPFFPDFVTIDHFKDAICTSLQEYNQHIESLKEEMEEATESAKDIRGEIQAFRNKYAFVKGQDKCSSCNFPLMTRNFYLFPCMHRFHTDCLVAEVTPYLTSAKRSQVIELQRRLGTHDGSSPSTPAQGKGQSLKVELDELVAGECVFCGDYMIRNIDKPFIDPAEYSEVISSWE
ncbi:unnamed protein product [Owenia fusiformis]|uniref:Vacuolar protein sorting-associated protein 18 homolog n=1 Tax=Owenia fusiformis TaxID=6347 RepID=A0A8J1U320_OWEFU|nr:unnamed protein product [Owenia fusiformis]